MCCSNNSKILTFHFCPPFHSFSPAAKQNIDMPHEVFSKFSVFCTEKEVWMFGLSFFVFWGFFEEGEGVEGLGMGFLDKNAS